MKRKGIAKCKLCQVSVGGLQCLQRHMEKYHSNSEQGHKCPICNTILYSKCLFERHKRKHLHKMVCKQCYKTFSNAYYLQKHMEVHNKNRKTFSCGKCSKRFYDLVSLDRHLLVHGIRKTFSCHICSAELPNRSALNKHMKFTHPKPPIKFYCQACNKSYHTEGGLLRHIKIEHEGYRVEWELCGKHMTSQGALKYHMVMHRGMKTEKCLVCDERFAHAFMP